MKFGGIIFDLDGTLINTAGLSLKAYRYALKRVTGREFLDQEIKANFGPSEEGVIKRLAGEKWQECFKYYIDYEIEHLDSVKAFIGIESVLKLLQMRQIRLAIATGRGKANSTVFLKHTQLKQYFDLIETGTPESYTKQLTIERVLTKWNIPRYCVAYVGDVVEDMEIAQSVGLIPLWAVWSVPNFEDNSDIRKFYTVSEFLAWLQENIEKCEY